MNPLALILAVAVAQAVPSPVFTLRTGGGPGGPEFNVTLSEGGRLSVEKAAMPITADGLTRTRVVVTLSKDEVTRLESLARDATDFAKGCDRVADGTDAILVVSGRKRQCHGAAKWPQGRRTSRFLAELNSHLDEPHRVY